MAITTNKPPFLPELLAVHKPSTVLRSSFTIRLHVDRYVTAEEGCACDGFSNRRQVQRVTVCRCATDVAETRHRAPIAQEVDAGSRRLVLVSTHLKLDVRFQDG